MIAIPLKKFASSIDCEEVALEAYNSINKALQENNIVGINMSGVRINKQSCKLIFEKLHEDLGIDFNERLYFVGASSEFLEEVY